MVTWSSNTTSTGPCSLTIGSDGGVCIRDLTTSATVWCNGVKNNGTCGPYSLGTTAEGLLVETDCANNTVWKVPSPPSSVISPFIGPNPGAPDKEIIGTGTGAIDTFKPYPGNSTGPPIMKIFANCTSAIANIAGTTTWVNTIASTGPCALVMSANCTVSIVDIPTSATVWTNGIAGACAPCSLQLLLSGQLVEQDCKNNTIWSVPTGVHAPHQLNVQLVCLPTALVAILNGSNPAFVAQHLSWCLAQLTLSLATATAAWTTPPAP
jgi:hypothetical protein